MKLASLLSPAAAVAIITVAVLASTSGVQATQDQPPAAQAAPCSACWGFLQGNAMAPGGQPMRSLPAPTNLQVLPKDLTAMQVREIMGGWAGSLGVHCDFCHAADPSKKMPNGRPMMNFAEDSKDEKKIARIMLSKTQQINADYISKTKTLDTDSMGMTVTCGTCHRGHSMPEDFVLPKEGGPTSACSSACWRRTTGCRTAAREMSCDAVRSAATHETRNRPPTLVY